MLRGLVLVATAAIALVLFSAPVVSAHAALVAANPGPDDTVKVSPTELVARFSQNLDPSRTQLEVRNAAGDSLARGGEPGSTKREFVLPLPQLAPGKYQVRWTSFSSEDGELARGSYSFTVIASPTPSPTPQASPTSSPSAETPPTPRPTVSLPSATPTASLSPEQPDGASDVGPVLIPIVVALMFVIVIAGWLLRGRRA